MEEYSIACLVSLKCDEIKHNNSNCRLYQHSWLLCTFYGEYKAAWTREDLKRGATAGFFILLREQLCQKEYTFTKYNTLLHV